MQVVQQPERLAPAGRPPARRRRRRRWRCPGAGSGGGRSPAGRGPGAARTPRTRPRRCPCSAASVSRLARVSAARSASDQDACRLYTRASRLMASGRNPASCDQLGDRPAAASRRRPRAGPAPTNISRACSGGRVSSSTRDHRAGQVGQVTAAGDQHQAAAPRPAAAAPTWALLAALSRTSSARCPAIRSRHSAARPARSAGQDRGSTPVAASSPASAASGASGSWPGVWPRRSMNSCRSGNRSRSRCAACTASAVFPTPGIPPIARTAAAPPPGRGRPRTAWPARRDLVQLAVAAGERRGVGRQRVPHLDGAGLAARPARRPRRPRRARAGSPRQDSRVQPLQLRPGLGAQLLDQDLAGRLVGGQRRVPAARPGTARSSAARAAAPAAAQPPPAAAALHDHVRVPAQVQVGVDAGLQRLQPQLGQPRPLPARPARRSPPPTAARPATAPARRPACRAASAHDPARAAARPAASAASNRAMSSVAGADVGSGTRPAR